MELKDFVEQALDEADTLLSRALDGLTVEELAWRPSREANSIGFLLWHSSRVEDGWIWRLNPSRPQVYEAEGWYEKFGTERRDSGHQYTAEQLERFTVPPLDQLLEYGKSVRNRTLHYLKEIPVGKLDEKPIKDRPEYTIGGVFRHLVVELSQHIGQIAYLRGLRRGLNK